nr:uncharacterized protein LOC106686518 [Halyomorpha halys]
MIMRPIPVLLVVSSSALFGLVVGQPTYILQGESDVDSDLPLVEETVEDEVRCIEEKCCSNGSRCCLENHYCCKEGMLSIEGKTFVCLSPYSRKIENKHLY